MSKDLQEAGVSEEGLLDHATEFVARVAGETPDEYALLLEPR